MSQSHSIRITLNLKDKNIIFGENYLEIESIKGVETLVYSGNLSPATPKKCRKCNLPNISNSIIKNGSKVTTIKLPNISNCRAILRLKKQRYFCRNCQQTFTAETEIVKKNHTISNNTNTASLLEAKSKISIKDIAERYNISPSTLNNRLAKVNADFKINYNYLPENLLFDEFKSVKSVLHNMSFIYMNAESGEVIDIVQNRRLSYLKSYF